MRPAAPTQHLSLIRGFKPSSVYVAVPRALRRVDGGLRRPPRAAVRAPARGPRRHVGGQPRAGALDEPRRALFGRGRPPHRRRARRPEDARRVVVGGRGDARLRRRGSAPGPESHRGAAARRGRVDLRAARHYGALQPGGREREPARPKRFGDGPVLRPELLKTVRRPAAPRVRRLPEPDAAARGPPAAPAGRARGRAPLHAPEGNGRARRPAGPRQGRRARPRRRPRPRAGTSLESARRGDPSTSLRGAGIVRPRRESGIVRPRRGGGIVRRPSGPAAAAGSSIRAARAGSSVSRQVDAEALSAPRWAATWDGCHYSRAVHFPDARGRKFRHQWQGGVSRVATTLFLNSVIAACAGD